MSKFTVNGIGLEYDIYELENAKKYKEELEKVTVASQNSLFETDIVKKIEMQCNAVFDFIDNLFGKGKHKELFGKSVNLKKCIQIFREITKAIVDLQGIQEELTAVEEIAEKTKKTTSKKGKSK